MDIKKKLGTALITLGSNVAMLSFALASASDAGLPEDVIKVVNNVLGAAQAVGVIVAVGILLFAGFKFMTAGAGDKAKAKDMLVPFAIGALLVATAPGIANWVFNSIAVKSSESIS